MTSISGYQGQIDLKFGGQHRLVILHQHNKFIKIEDSHVKFTKMFFIDLSWNAPYVEICMINRYVIVICVCINITNQRNQTLHVFARSG